MEFKRRVYLRPHVRGGSTTLRLFSVSGLFPDLTHWGLRSYWLWVRGASLLTLLERFAPATGAYLCLRNLYQQAGNNAIASRLGEAIGSYPAARRLRNYAHYSTLSGGRAFSDIARELGIGVCLDD